MPHATRFHQAALLEVILETLARTKQTLPYHAVAAMLGTNPRDPGLYTLLDGTMRLDHEEGQPYRCSSVVQKSSGIPGEAYFALAEELGESFQVREDFHKQALDRLWAAWA